jgi:hypothetical protein
MTTATFNVAKVCCDRTGCPAPAVRHVELYGQDFHFCNHHACELEQSLRAAMEQERPTALRRPARHLVRA